MLSKDASTKSTKKPQVDIHFDEEKSRFKLKNEVSREYELFTKDAVTSTSINDDAKTSNQATKHESTDSIDTLLSKL